MVSVAPGMESPCSVYSLPIDPVPFPQRGRVWRGRQTAASCLILIPENEVLEHLLQCWGSDEGSGLPQPRPEGKEGSLQPQGWVLGP